RREDVLDYILKTYGAEQTAICCMVDTFRARMAIREVGKALGLPPEEIDLVAKAFPRVRARDIPQAIERLPELSGTNLDGGQLQQLFELCVAIDGFPRHLALHPSGVVLSSPDLADRVPMQESFGGFTMLQADKDDVEELGLAKLDVLGVRMLSSIAHAADEIVRIHGKEIDLDDIPRDDEATFDLVRSSRTLGCFQIESPGQRELLARFQPSRFEDLIIDISLFRPGPVKSDMISPFLDRRHGFQQSSYAHEVLRPILAETNGVVVYHEQVIRVIAAVTGCSLDDADYVRRHLDAERPAAPGDPDSRPGRAPGADAPVYTHMDFGCGAGRGGGNTQRILDDSPPVGAEWSKGQRVHYHGVAGPIEIAPPEDDVGAWFKAGAVRNGFTPRQASVLWKEVFSFASFGFCKSHAAAFALPTYVSAWLKTHHPAEFLAGVLTHDPGMYPRRLIVADARQMGIPILPVDINRSDRVYRAEWVGGEEAGVDPLLCSDSPRSAAEGTSAALLRNSPSGAAPPPPPGSVGSCVDTGLGSSSPSGFLRRAEPGSTRRGELTEPWGTPLGIRLAFAEVRDISDAEMDSILEARKSGPFASLEDLWRRAEVSRPVLENLVHVGALDCVAGERSRRELLWRAVDLASQPKTRVGRQLSLSLDEPIQQELPGLADYDARERTEAELEVTGIDARHHVMEHYAELTAELGCVSAAELGGCRNRSEAWVAGVKVASQTPAIRSGQRIIFVTLDELTGPIDVTVFERVQPRCARTIFHSWLLVVKGEVRKRGGASLVHRTNPTNVGITVVADEVFDLALLASDHRRGMTIGEALDRQRQIQEVQGLAPGGADDAPSRLWHSSGGSAGR
ncbi:MAG TPA: OB-fold nucleic acid binding domain-containing protein, partial [Actinomycetota bacterium]